MSNPQQQHPQQSQLPVPADLIGSFEQGFNKLELCEYLPLQMVWDLKNLLLHNLGLAYRMGFKDAGGVMVQIEYEMPPEIQSADDRGE